MTTLIGLALVVLAIVFVLLPLFRKPATDTLDNRDPTILRSGLYRQILDAELDTHLGKLQPTDYVELRARLLQEAATLIVTAEGETVTGSEASARVEHEIAAARAALRGNPSLRGVNA